MAYARAADRTYPNLASRTRAYGKAHAALRPNRSNPDSNCGSLRKLRTTGRPRQWVYAFARIGGKRAVDDIGVRHRDKSNGQAYLMTAARQQVNGAMPRPVNKQHCPVGQLKAAFIDFGAQTWATPICRPAAFAGDI